MRKRVMIIVFLVFVLILSATLLLSEKREPEKAQIEPIVITVHGSLEEKTIDNLIQESELIIIGKVDTVFPSKWKLPNGKIPEYLTARTILENDMSIITDHLISIDKMLKGNHTESTVRVRAFAGEIDQVRFVSSSEPSYRLGQSYLLFLHKDHGPTQIVDPGDYIALNAIYGVYEIVDEKAISVGDEWLLEDLISYIEKSLSSEPPVPTETLPPTATNVSTETAMPPTETPLPAETPTSTP